MTKTLYIEDEDRGAVAVVVGCSPTKRKEKLLLDTNVAQIKFFSLQINFIIHT